METSTPPARSTANPFVPIPFRVTGVGRETADTVTLTLEPPGGAFPFTPGQFTMLSLPGIGEVPISISGDPDDPSRLVQTVRNVGAVSKALTGLVPGRYVGVRGPYGRGWPVADHEGRDIVIMAGGVGLAPLRPVVHHVRNRAGRYGRGTLLYGARTPDDLLFPMEVADWDDDERFDSLVTVDAAPAGWSGSVGVVTRLLSRAAFDPATAAAFVCGPEVMMRFGAMALVEAGVAAERISVSLERNMKCGVGLCGRCQCGPLLACKDGPVIPWSRAARLMGGREL